MFKKIITVIFIISFAFTAKVFAEGTYSGGSGEPNDPYLIANAADMNEIGAHPNDWGAHFLMTNDINMACYTGTQFNIIGRLESCGDGCINFRPFTGVFDGKDHTILNFTYNTSGENGIGLFGCIGGYAIIKNLRIENCDVNSTESGYVGCLVGANFYRRIENCSVKGRVSGETSVGLLTGVNDEGFISNCQVTGIVDGNNHTGGLVGSNSGIVLSSCANGTVRGNYTTGGLIGENGGKITPNDGFVSDCYSTADVYGNHNTGGLFGLSNLLKGLVGQCPVSNCYASGHVYGNDSAGGFAGSGGSDSHDNCFWDSEVNPDVNGFGNVTDPNVIGKSTAEMQTESTFTDAGWDFVEVWDIGENQTYPYLRVYPAGDLNHDGRVNLPDFAVFTDHWLSGF